MYLLRIGPGPTINHILLHMEKEYPTDVPTTFAFVWVNRDFPQALKELLNNSEYIHLRSNGYIDFFFPGYRLDTDIDDKWNILNSWEFDIGLFVEAIEYIEGISKWHYSGNSEILFLEYLHGRIQFKDSLSLNVDYLLENNVIASVSSLMEAIIKIAKSCTRVSEFSRKLNYMEIKQSSLHAIKEYISNKFKGIHIGAFRCRNLER